jgi:hypothetical protein
MSRKKFFMVNACGQTRIVPKPMSRKNFLWLMQIWLTAARQESCQKPCQEKNFLWLMQIWLTPGGIKNRAKSRVKKKIFYG